MTFGFIPPRVGGNAANSVAVVRVALTAAVPAALVDDRWWRLPLVTALAPVVRVSVSASVEVVLTATRPLLARARRAFHRVAISR